MAVYAHNSRCITPIMTSANTPTPFVVTGSSVNGASPTRLPWRAFSQSITDSNDGWYSATDNTGWLQVYLGPIGMSINGYTLTGHPTVTSPDPRIWTLQGSFNGTNYITLDTRTEESLVVGAMRTFSIPPTAAYNYYKINITSTQGAWTPGVYELELLGLEHEHKLPMRGRSRF